MKLDTRVHSLEKRFPPRKPIMAECELEDGSTALLTIDEMITRGLDWKRLHGGNNHNLADLDKLLAYMRQSAEVEV